MRGRWLRRQADQRAGIDRTATLARIADIAACLPQILLVVGEAKPPGDVERIGDVPGLVGEDRVGVVGEVVGLADRLTSPAKSNSNPKSSNTSGNCTSLG